jgi:DNA-binding transcriptional ArsR family regulator
MTPQALNRELDHPAREEIRLERVLHALSDPLRLGVVRTLAATPDGLPCHAFGMPVGKSTATHHLRVLREAGLIEQAYQGTSKWNVLRGEDLESLFPGLLGAMLNAADRQTDRLG